MACRNWSWCPAIRASASPRWCKELHKAFVPPRGLFTSGKFDHDKRDIPYATIGQALHGLVHDILGKSDAEVESWRTALRAATGPNGQLIVNLVPELDLHHRPPAARSGSAAAGRATPFPSGVPAVPHRVRAAAHPLVLFLDDLQWLDAATLDLLAYLVHPGGDAAFFAGRRLSGQRVGPAHPLMRTLGRNPQRRRAGSGHRAGPSRVRRYQPACRRALHCGPERAEPLAQLVQAKTGGNPFFVIQFLTMLVEEGALRFDPATQAWQWDIDRLRANGYTDNVAALMAVKLKRLPASTRESLQALACLGNEAELATLALAHGTSDASCTKRSRMPCRPDSSSGSRTGTAFRTTASSRRPTRCFPTSERADVHLHMGRRLSAGMTGDDSCGAFVRDRQSVQSRRGVADRPPRESPGGGDQFACRPQGQGGRGLRVGAARILPPAWRCWKTAIGGTNMP